MKNKHTQKHDPSINAPVLSLRRDRRMAESTEGWALYETPTKWVYCGIPHPEGDEYIIPINASLIRNFRIIAKRGDPSSVISQLENLSGLSGNSPATAKGDDPEAEPPVPPEEYAEDILYLTPGRDQIWGTGKDVTAFVSANGIPYFVHEDFCICCSTATFCTAYQLLEKDEPAEVKTDFSEEGNPCFTVTHVETTICFHICDEPLEPDHTQNVNVVHVSPTRLEGRHNGHVLSIRR